MGELGLPGLVDFWLGWIWSSFGYPLCLRFNIRLDDSDCFLFFLKMDRGYWLLGEVICNARHLSSSLAAFQARSCELDTRVSDVRLPFTFTTAKCRLMVSSDKAPTLASPPQNLQPYERR